jgi:prepilin-type N-terminal cleavage/methylation domain-containing protein
MRYASRDRAQAAFSIIELLIAIIIIGILVAIIIPVLMKRADEARLAAAESDLEHLQAAEERAAIDTGYLYRFYVLDDVIGGNGVYLPFDINDTDGIRDERYNTQMATPTRIFLHMTDGLFISDYATLYQRLIRNETAFGWAGPYVNVHKLRDADFNDIPEDPWGSDYLLFTPEGLVDQYQGRILTSTTFFAIDAGTTVILQGPFFDRYTVLSTGPNNAPGDATSTARFGTDDDLFRQF